MKPKLVISVARGAILTAIEFYKETIRINPACYKAHVEKPDRIVA